MPDRPRPAPAPSHRLGGDGSLPRDDVVEMSALQSQARALGDPTRHEIFRYLRDAAEPVDVAELTGHVGLHPNAVRQHVAKLEAAGLVVERTAAPTGRGRPRLLYSVDPRADGRWTGGGPYERLAVLLTEALRTGDDPEEVGRREGVRQRRETTTIDPTRDGATAVDPLVDRMAHLGFDPVVRRRGRTIEVVLRHCPFASAAIADADTVCGLHLGLARGLVEADPAVVVDDLVTRDPRRAQCRLRCRVDATA